MLDSKSIEVINNFKNALKTRQLPVITNSKVLDSNRGNKLDTQGIESKIVEFNGVEYLIGSNQGMEKLVGSNKRKWKDYQQGQDEDVVVDDDVYVDDDDHDDDDEDGEDQDDDQDDDDKNPLDDFDITEILGAINHPSDLVVHAAILKTYKLKVLHKLSTELIELIELEQHSLNNFNNLLSILNGEDWYYLLEENMGLPEYDHGLTNDEKQEEIKDNIPDDIKPVDLEYNEKPPKDATNKLHDEAKDIKDTKVNDGEKRDDGDDRRITRNQNQDDEVTDEFFKLPEVLKNYELNQLRVLNNNNNNNNDDDDESNKYNLIKDELINSLQISIQRQQEYIKNLSNLRNQIVRADRLKNQLYKWSKEMNDKK